MKERTVDDHLQEKLRDPYFKELYELEQQKFSIVKNIIDFRIKHHLSQADLAKQLKVTQQHISNIESGEFSSVSTLEKVLLGIGMTVRIEAIKLNPQVRKRIVLAMA
jgi:DNA-binding XRE family transcriptional regulator